METEKRQEVEPLDEEELQGEVKPHGTGADNTASSDPAEGNTDGEGGGVAGPPR